ncbi:hypothetical protein L3X38_004487 [Prunus dulcis]|uniref:Uncharacterized protein n=1 Tax=Prunus dulcis TaxID=3755 RepID=A0AAD4ZP40_PRUDU|nr:hypothetical protein L3X38_004487 [Prunus dulcis]
MVNLLETKVVSSTIAAPTLTLKRYLEANFNHQKETFALHDPGHHNYSISLSHALSILMDKVAILGRLWRNNGDYPCEMLGPNCHFLRGNHPMLSLLNSMDLER